MALSGETAGTLTELLRRFLTFILGGEKRVPDTVSPLTVSPAEVVDAVPVPRWGKPELNRICTSHVERQNLSIRMGIRRMTRLTNAFSKKWENLKAAYALWFAFYNFCRVHQTLRVTPAMQAGITDHIWTIKSVLA
jgi:hypothetical protein